MSNRESGRVLYENEERLVDTGLDEETVQEFVDGLIDELYQLEEEIDEEDEEERTGDE